MLTVVGLLSGLVASCRVERPCRLIGVEGVAVIWYLVPELRQLSAKGHDLAVEVSMENSVVSTVQADLDISCTALR